MGLRTFMSSVASQQIQGTFLSFLWSIEDKFLAVPSARVAHMLAPLTYSPGLKLVGGSAPKPLAYYCG